MYLLGFQSFVCFIWEIYDCYYSSSSSHYYYYYYNYYYLLLTHHHCKIPADSTTMDSISCFWWKKNCTRYISWPSPNICSIFLSVSHYRHQHRLLRTQNLSDRVYKQKSLSSLRRRTVWIGRFVYVCVCVFSPTVPPVFVTGPPFYKIPIFFPVGWISTVRETS